MTMAGKSPSGGAANLYVYYRLRADIPTGRAAARIIAMQESVKARSPADARVMRRLEDPTTWMEVYERVGNLREFEALLAEEVAKAGLDDLVEPGSARHVEHFVDVAAAGEAG